MAKRKKWSEEEDTALRQIVHNFDGGAVNWNEVSQRMGELGFAKASRQVRERWSNHLDPKLEQDSLKTEDDRRLLDLHIRHGNAWKTIAKSFRGRSDNRIKNQFFSMIRKSLRNARRCLKKSSNTEQINSIKPWVLSKFINESLTVPSHLAGEVKVFPWSRQNPLSVRDFVEFFLLNKFVSFEAELNEKTSKLIAHILDYVKRMNVEYCREAKKPPVKKRRIAKKVPVRRTEPPQPKAFSVIPKPQPVSIKNKITPPKVTKPTSIRVNNKSFSPPPNSETCTKKLVLNDNLSDELSDGDWPHEQHTVRFRRQGSDNMSINHSQSRRSFAHFHNKERSVSIDQGMTHEAAPLHFWQQSPCLGLNHDPFFEAPQVYGASRSLESLRSIEFSRHRQF